MRKLYPFIAIFLFACLIAACKKDNKPAVTGNTGSNATGTPLDKIKDSVYLFANEDYLWNNQLPTYSAFQPRSFTDASDLNALQNEMDKLSQYAINPATSQPYEYYANDPGIAKYSFIDDGSTTAALNGVKGDFGFNLKYNLVNDLRIEYVYPGSPAGNAGIQRGYQITSVNGNSNISYDATGYGTGTSTNLNFVSNAVFNSNSITLTLQRPDGTSFTTTLNTASYNVNPVLKDTVLTVGNGLKVGYIVFNSFTSGAVANPVLDAAFSGFTSQGITDLVVDLRYNGGGYVSTAEHLDNLIVPASKSGSLMYTTYYNTNLQNDIYPLLATKFNISKGDFKPANNQSSFAKVGSLNLPRVFFIITNATASASELTINNLRPFMDVEYVGRKSYGKPVGFFGIPISKYIMYTPEFYTQNSAGQGGYYDGFTPGAGGYPGLDDYDDLTHNFGDPKEGLLYDVLTYISTGAYPVYAHPATNSLLDRRSFALKTANNLDMHVGKPEFNGMILKSNGQNKLTPKNR